MSTPLSSARSPRVSVAMDPAIAAVMRDASAPEGIVKRVWPPRTLPGSCGPSALARAGLGNLLFGARYLDRMRELHGDIYRDMAAAEPLVVVSDADEIHKILRNEDNLWSSAMAWDLLAGRPHRSGLGPLLMRDFEVHRSARKLLAPAFSSKAIKGYLQIEQRALSRAVPDWLRRGHVDFKPASRRLLAAIASDIFTGIEDPVQVAKLDRALADFWHAPMALVKDARFSPTFRRSVLGLRTLRDTFTALLPERRAQPGPDLFSQLCQAKVEGSTDDELVTVFLSILFGAFDTTSSAVASMAYLLARHPEWQERLRDEARQVPEEALDWSSLQGLEQLEWVWKETLRLLPINNYVPRRPLREAQILGHRLAAGTLVGVANGAVSRHPQWWTQPQRFDPERFSPARAEDKQHPAIFLPFGAGAHACVGMQLANIEAKVLWHYLLTRCRFELSRDYQARHTFTPFGCVSGRVSLRLHPL